MGNINSTGFNSQGNVPINYSSNPEDIILAKAVIVIDENGNIEKPPTGLATSAKQPAIGTAGSPSADVLTIQGITNATPIATVGSITNTTFGASQNGNWQVSLDANTISELQPNYTGAATSTLQSIGNASLSSIDSKIPTLVNGRLPVDIQSLNVNVSNSQLEISNDVGNPVPVNGTVSITSLPTGSNTIGSIANTTFAVTQSGPWAVGNITGTVSLPTGAATSALQTIGNTSLASIATSTANLPVGLTVTSTRLLVDPSGVTSPISAASLPLPTGAATSANQTTGNSSLASIVTNTTGIATAANQTTMQASLSSIVTNTTGAATSALQTTGNTTLSTISTSLTSILARLMPVGTDTNYIGTSVADCVKTSSGSLYSITAVNLNTATRYLQIFNQATVPTTGNVPVRVFTLFGSGGNALVGQDLIGGSGISLSTGVAWGVSTTPLTYTAATITDTIVSVRWI